MPGIRTRRRTHRGPSLRSMSIHFAVLTLVGTGLLAMFTQGETERAASPQTQASAATAEDAVSRAAHGNGSNTIRIARRDPAPGTFGPDAKPNRPSGSMAYANSFDDTSEPALLAGSGLPSAGPTAPPLPAALPEGMTFEEWLAQDGATAAQARSATRQLGPADVEAMGVALDKPPTAPPLSGPSG